MQRTYIYIYIFFFCCIWSGWVNSLPVLVFSHSLSIPGPLLMLTPGPRHFRTIQCGVSEKACSRKRWKFYILILYSNPKCTPGPRWKSVRRALWFPVRYCLVFVWGGELWVGFAVVVVLLLLLLLLMLLLVLLLLLMLLLVLLLLLWLVSNRSCQRVCLCVCVFELCACVCVCVWVFGVFFPLFIVCFPLLFPLRFCFACYVCLSVTFFLCVFVWWVFVCLSVFLVSPCRFAYEYCFGFSEPLSCVLFAFIYFACCFFNRPQFKQFVWNAFLSLVKWTIKGKTIRGT